jgi:hypothetical protein
MFSAGFDVDPVAEQRAHDVDGPVLAEAAAVPVLTAAR